MAAPKSWGWNFALLGGLTVGTLILEWVLHNRPTGIELAYASHRLFQRELIMEDPPITLVDISDLEVGEAGTPRQELQDLLMAIASHNPKAIGVDIDFSPDESGHVDLVDPDFFARWLRLTQNSKVQVFLGVGRTVGVEGSGWLGSSEYQKMAAAILIPKDTRKLVYSVGPKDKLDGPAPLRSFSAALARAYGEAPPGKFVNWLAEMGLIARFLPRPVGNLVLEEYPVNYSSIGALPTFRTTSADFIRNPAIKPFIEDRVVIVGDVALARDTFPVEGREKAYAGAMLHASGTATLIKRPLYEVTGLGRFALTILLMIVTFLPVFFRRWVAGEKRGWLEHLHGTMIVVYTVVFAFGFAWFMRSTNIVWDGFFLALFALALHRPVEDAVEWIMEKRERPKSAAAAVLLVVLSATTANAQEKVGYISALSGPVSYQRKGTANIRKLAAKDVAEAIYAGDRLKCDRGGSAWLQIGRKSQQLTSSSEWFTVPPWNEPVSLQAQAALAAATVPAARRKSAVLANAFRVLAPVNGSNAVLRTLTLRWRPGTADCPITASVDDANGKRIWLESGIPAPEGRLDSNALRAALRDADGPFDLHLADACKNQASVSFDVLASEDVALLQSDLKAWDAEATDPLFRHLGRAGMYSQHRLFLEVAEEYEKALALAPDSAALLARTIEAHDRNGNVPRSRELAARLPADH